MRRISDCLQCNHWLLSVFLLKSITRRVQMENSCEWEKASCPVDWHFALNRVAVIFGKEIDNKWCSSMIFEQYSSSSLFWRHQACQIISVGSFRFRLANHRRRGHLQTRIEDIFLRVFLFRSFSIAFFIFRMDQSSMSITYCAYNRETEWERERKRKRKKYGQPSHHSWLETNCTFSQNEDTRQHDVS